MTPTPTPSAADPLALQTQALLAADNVPAQAYVDLARNLYGAQRRAEGAQVTRRGLERHPGSFDLWHLRGVFLRTLRQFPESLAAFNRAVELDTASIPALVNRGNLLLDMQHPTEALASFNEAIERDPQGAMPQTMAGRALLRLNRMDEALSRFQNAARFDPQYLDGWLQLTATLQKLGHLAEAEAAFETALAANPDHLTLLEAKAMFLRASGPRIRVEEFLEAALLRLPMAAWLHFHLADAVAATDPARAATHLRRALALDPGRVEHMVMLLQVLDRSTGESEGATLDEAYKLCAQLRASVGALNPAQTAVLYNVLLRLCDFDAVASLPSFETRGRAWASAGLHGFLLRQIGQANSTELRKELLEQHRIWGAAAEAQARAAPIQIPAPRPAGGKIRLGIMSSDLRAHAVGYFALSLFENIDRERFEVFVYSYALGESDEIQERVRQRVDGFRLWPEISARDAAQRIADDQLDILIELGGSTAMNKLEVMAYRPAPIQASYLGYPHSSGLSTIDYYICDPQSQPSEPGLLLEAPLLMPRSWIAMSPILTGRAPPLAEQSAVERKGYVTFGTANTPAKYTHEVLTAWARVVAATPGSHFAFIRPEAGSAVFRRNVAAAFQAQGVAPDRIDWRPVRGRHLQFYNEIDISLDTFPLTGGTTTVESLLMGVPVVSLVGQAFHERLSYSILSSVGLSELCAENLDAFQAAAVALAADRPRLAELRRSLRATLDASPLGDVEGYARDFYDLIHRTVTAARVTAKA